MSLAHSHKDLATKDASTTLRLKPAEVRPRFLSQPDTQPDDKTFRKEDKDDKVYFKAHGNAKPQEPPFMATRRKGFPTRVAGHIHAKAWSSSPMPGKKENPASNQFRRTWIADGASTDKIGKWTQPKMKQYFEDQDRALVKLKPHDEVFAKNSNMKYWTHLEGEGTMHGGQQKLELYPERATGLHLKGGLYSGKFENVRHAQLILSTGFRTNNGDGRLQEWHKDSKRPAFDNRLKDDMIRRNDKNSAESSKASYEIYRPCATMSCPQLGAEHVMR